jgi:nuclear pore complex protein Nup133
VCILSCGQCLTGFPKDSDYRHRLELKSATDRTLGVGVMGSENAVLILTAATMIRASLDMDQIHNFNPEYVHCVYGFLSFYLNIDRTGQANLIKSIMMQAIVYGSIAEVTHKFGLKKI